MGGEKMGGGGFGSKFLYLYKSASRLGLVVQWRRS